MSLSVPRADLTSFRTGRFKARYVAGTAPRYTLGASPQSARPEGSALQGDTREEPMSRLAAAHIDPENLVIVVVGDRQTVEAPLRALALGPIRTLTVEKVLGPPPQIE
jgi:hypothetical protein